MSCPVCSNTEFEPAFVGVEMFDGERFGVSRCTECGVLRTDGEPTLDELAEYYEYDGGGDAGERFVGPLEPVMRALRRARVRALTAGKAPGRALDVGCGRGEMLAALQESGWDVYGTELDETVAATARARLGDRVQIGALRELSPPDKPFDVISFWHVLEHLPDPRGELERATEWLAADGHVVVGIPNLGSWQARLGGERWLHLDVPRHRWHFSAEHLERLAQNVGLRLDDVSHFSLEYGPYGLLQSALTRAGLGFTLFTDILRPGRRDRWLRNPRVWAHGALALPIAALGAASFPVEALAAAAGAGGAITAILRRS